MKRIFLSAPFYSIAMSLLLSACVQPPVFKDAGYAHIKSSHLIISVNGTSIDKTYKLDIASGKNSLLAVYSTYRYDYLCTFNWVAMAGTVYEITDQENAYPLTLYRWQRRNGLWAIRLNPVYPTECIRKPK